MLFDVNCIPLFIVGEASLCAYHTEDVVDAVGEVELTGEHALVQVATLDDDLHLVIALEVIDDTG